MFFQYTWYLVPEVQVILLAISLAAGAKYVLGFRLYSPRDLELFFVVIYWSCLLYTSPSPRD